MWTTPTTEARPTDSPTPPPGGLKLRIVFHAIRRHPLALFGVFAFAATVGACIWLFMPLPKKTAAVVFYVAPHTPSILTSAVDSRVSFESYRQSQTSIVKLRRTLNTALNDPKVRGLQILKEAEPDPLSWLEKIIAVDSRGGAEYMRITVEGDQEKELLILIEAVANAYQKATLDRDNGGRLTRQAELLKESNSLKQELAVHHKAIEDIARRLGATNETMLAILAALQEQSLRSAMQEHVELLDKLAAAKLALEAAKNGSRRNAVTAVTGAIWFGTLPQAVIQISPTAIEQELLRDRVLPDLELSVAKARDALIKTEGIFEKDPNPVPPQLATARAELKAAEEKRDKYKTEAQTLIQTRLESLVRERMAQDESSRLATVQNDHDQISLRERQAWAKIEGIRKTIEEHTGYKLRLDNIRTEIAQKEALAAQMTLESERLRVELKAPARVTQSEEPHIVTGIEGNRKLKFALLATVATFCLGFAGVVFWEYRSRRVTHTDEVSTNLGARLIGTIPPLVPSSRAPSPAHSDLVEAIDTTRIMLMHGAPLDGDVRVLLVTSAVSGEGKTTLSGNLAISLTRAGFRTLLVDGDTRAPTAHNLFNLPDGPGLGELLREEVDVATAVRNAPIPGLSILPAGNWTQATHQMLVGSRWRHLKRELKEQFDFVVIDTSPLLLVSDTMLLAREADGVVLSVLLGVSQIARVAETVNRLNAVGARLSGVVVNNVRSAAAQHADAYRAKYYASGSAALLPEAGLMEETDSLPKNG